MKDHEGAAPAAWRRRRETRRGENESADHLMRVFVFTPPRFSYGPATGRARRSLPHICSIPGTFVGTRLQLHGPSWLFMVKALLVFRASSPLPESTIRPGDWSA